MRKEPVSFGSSRTVPDPFSRRRWGMPGQAFHPAGLVGVFPVGGRFDGADAVDIRYRPGLAGFRANFLIATVLSPLLKRVAEPRPLEVWVPLSSAEVKRRDRKRDRSGAPKSRPSRPATRAKR